MAGSESAPPILVASFPTEAGLETVLTGLVERKISRDFIGTLVKDSGSRPDGTRTYLLSVLAPSRLHQDIRAVFAEAGATDTGGAEEMAARWGEIPHPGVIDDRGTKTPAGSEHWQLEAKRPAGRAARSKIEKAALAMLALILFGLPAVVFGYGSIAPRPSAHNLMLVGADGHWSGADLHVRQGERVRLSLTSDDVLHGFRLEGYDLEADAVYPGRVTRVDFVADKPGTFPFNCTVICSLNHRHMEGQLIVDGQGGSSARSSVAR